MSPTLKMKTVAERAGVSVSTVSRALARPDLVSEATRRKIFSIVEDLGYAVNAATTNLRGARTGVVIVLISDVSNPFVGQLLKGIQNLARQAGFSILIGDDSDDPDINDGYVQQLVGHRADGVIIVTGKLAEHEVFETGEVPVVAISERIRDGIPLVGIDNISASTKAVQHLIGLGHRRIAHLAGPRSSKLTTDRLAGYRLGLLSADIPYDDSLVRHCDFTLASGREMTGALLEAKSRPTAIFAASDDIAVGAMARLREAGLSVPKDMSVVGFDDVAMSEVIFPPLTTVHQPRLEMGTVAMGMILDLLEGQKILHDRVLPSHLVIRESTAPYPR